jgi:transposase
MPVMIGVDPHKASHTAAALDEQGQLLGRQRVPATLVGYRALRQWAGRWQERRWAVEGAHGIGRALAQRLVGDGEPVLDVPAKLAARVRVLSVGHGRKSDPDDAVSVAVAARSAPALRRVGVEDQATVLHLLTKRRQDLVAARTQTINRLHRLLMDLVPGGARRNLTAKRAESLLAAVTPAGQPAVTRWQLATELVADVRHLEQRIAAVEARIKAASPSPTRPWFSCSGSGRCWPPSSLARSATSVGSRPSIISPPIPAPPRWRPPAARWFVIGCPGPGTAS